MKKYMRSREVKDYFILTFKNIFMKKLKITSQLIPGIFLGIAYEDRSLFIALIFIVIEINFIKKYL